MQRTYLALSLCAALALGCSDDGVSTDQISIRTAPPAAWTDDVIESYDKTSGEHTMRVEIFTRGTGEVLEIADRVTANYRGWLPGRNIAFDSSFLAGKPYAFTIGDGRVIPGWELGAEGLTVGTRARFHIPAGLGYGDTGNPPVIPRKAKLIFDFEVVSAR